MKKLLLLFLVSACTHADATTELDNEQSQTGQNTEVETEKGVIALPHRVNVQSEYAPSEAIIDGEWVAVGSKKKHAIGRDYDLLFNGKPSFRFELKADDNSLSGYEEGTTKGRAELSYCYATKKDFAGQPVRVYESAQKLKTVYHHGKGICSQGSSMAYEFSVYIPSDIDESVSTIFAQWHGMPDRRLVETPDGEIKMLTTEEFLQLDKTTLFEKDTGYEKIEVIDKKTGEIKYKKGKPNGWKIEQGGYPPLAFGFTDGLFYIKANSDRKWLTDKTDRCNASPLKSDILVPKKSLYKASTIAYKMAMNDFPKDTWVSFKVNVDWTQYNGQSERIVKGGRLDVSMSYEKNNKPQSIILVDDADILIGRNDEDGYYFKFGIYRVGNSTVPVLYHLAGYKEYQRK
ncbi:heparin lyase I family protein [Bacteroides sp.]|uniref:heparin lyase I family protein n=1 Tax=Bacteroides sp. TaxID=29523 RepID=UPI002582ACE4|nr:heparin lyase I family protein [Bacteroides sp.]